MLPKWWPDWICDRNTWGRGRPALDGTFCDVTLLDTNVCHVVNVRRKGGPMKLTVAGSLMALVAFGQNPAGLRFVAADVHVSSKGQNQGTRPPTTRGRPH